MNRRYVGLLRDVIYNLEDDEDRWLGELARNFEPFFPGSSRVALGLLQLHEGGARIEKVGPAHPLIQLFLKTAASILPSEQLHEIMRHAPSVGSFSEWVRPLNIPNFWRTFSMGGLSMVDFVGLRALDGGDRFITVSAWYDQEQRTSEGLRATLTPMAAHLATMFRLRRALKGSPVCLEHGEAILDATGKVVHAEPSTTPPAIRESLRAHAKTMETAKTRNGVDSGDLWTPLVEGKWTLLDHHDTDGRRFYVAVENDPQFAETFTLSIREKQTAQMAAQGMANKEIAYALGVGLSSVATYLKRALHKLRLERRSELPMLFEQSTRTLPLHDVSIAAWGVTLQLIDGLTDAEQEVAKLAARGLTDTAIAAERGCSPRTVANILRSVYRKLGVANRTELVRALSQGSGGVSRDPCRTES